MEAILPAEPLQIRSQMGDYDVFPTQMDDPVYLEALRSARAALVDRRVWELYESHLAPLIPADRLILQDVNEDIKTADICLSYCRRMLEMDFKRGETFLAVGGGVIQDLATFTASILYRGIPWIYVPTTLLAQADSCIGGKSSLNIDQWKNQLGNFYPPRQIYILSQYLPTLTDADIRSGLGEVLKVHLLSGLENVEVIETDFPMVRTSDKVMAKVIRRALEIKAGIIQQDEFDTGLRLSMNYGHTFGHALEAASNFKIPHGIAVAFGTDMANHMAMIMERISLPDYQRMNSLLTQNLSPDDWHPIDKEQFLDALRHDKKNRPGEYCFILPASLGAVERVFVPMKPELESQLVDYLDQVQQWLEAS